MKRAQAIRRSPSEIAGVHQRRAYRLATTRAHRIGEVLGGVVLIFFIAAVFIAAHYGPHING